MAKCPFLVPWCYAPNPKNHTFVDNSATHSSARLVHHLHRRLRSPHKIQNPNAVRADASEWLPPPSPPSSRLASQAYIDGQTCEPPRPGGSTNHPSIRVAMIAGAVPVLQPVQQTGRGFPARAKTWCVQHSAIHVLCHSRMIAARLSRLTLRAPASGRPAPPQTRSSANCSPLGERRNAPKLLSGGCGWACSDHHASHAVNQFQSACKKQHQHCVSSPAQPGTTPRHARHPSYLSPAKCHPPPRRANEMLRRAALLASALRPYSRPYSLHSPHYTPYASALPPHPCSHGRGRHGGGDERQLLNRRHHLRTGGARSSRT